MPVDVVVSREFEVASGGALGLAVRAPVAAPGRRRTAMI